MRGEERGRRDAERRDAGWGGEERERRGEEKGRGEPRQ